MPKNKFARSALLWVISICLAAGLVSACSRPTPTPQIQQQVTPAGATPSAQALASPGTPSPQPSATPEPTATRLPTATATALPPVTIESLAVPSYYLGGSRVLTLFLPPSYHSEPQRRYKVLYANDGQDLPLLSIDQILRGYNILAQLEEIIVVAIPAGANREAEYGTGSIVNDFGQGTLAQYYTNFLIKEVLPLVNAKYRTLPGPENTGIMGWSLGGLSAFYTAWTHPEVFGITGAFSGSFWWRTKNNTLQDVLASRVVQKMVRESNNKPTLRMWFSAGTAEFDQDRDKNGVIDMVQDTTDLLEELSKKGYRNGVDYIYIQVEGGTHDLGTWAKVLPDFLRWAFPVVR